MASGLRKHFALMQLRVARLCLDCEELHTEERCPRCISEHYAMLTTWLPVEERRRFRRPAAPPVRRHGVLGMISGVLRWINGGEVVDPPGGWATRREDFAALESFEHSGKRPIVDARASHSRVPAAGSD